jgi:hypothetical protein
MWRPPGDWHEEAPKESVLAIGSAEIHGLKIGGQSNFNNFCSRIKSISYTRALSIAMLDSQRVSCIYIYVCMYVMYVCMYACMHACMHAWMDGCMYVCM